MSLETEYAVEFNVKSNFSELNLNTNFRKTDVMKYCLLSRPKYGDTLLTLVVNALLEEANPTKSGEVSLP